MNICFELVILLFCSLVTAADEDGAESWTPKSRDCSSHCSQTEDGAHVCWNGTLGFFERTLRTPLRGYILSQAKLALIGSERTDWADVAERTVNRLERLAPDEESNPNVVLDREVYARVVDALIADTKNLVEGIHSHDELSSIGCPHACEHPSDQYRSMFFVSAAVTLLIAAVYTTLYVYLDYRDNKLYIRQLETMQSELARPKRNKRSSTSASTAKTNKLN